jgi:hypothetical protein
VPGHLLEYIAEHGFGSVNGTIRKRAITLGFFGGRRDLGDEFLAEGFVPFLGPFPGNDEMLLQPGYWVAERPLFTLIGRTILTRVVAAGMRSRTVSDMLN